MESADAGPDGSAPSQIVFIICYLYHTKNLSLNSIERRKKMKKRSLALLLSFLLAFPVTVTADPGDSDYRSRSLHYAADYEEVYDALQSVTRYYYYEDWEDWMVEDIAADVDIAYSSEAYSSDTSSTAETSDYIDTNSREENISEGDVVKTDGTRIYLLQPDDEIHIFLANEGDPQPETILYPSLDFRNPDADNAAVQEFFVSGDQLFVILEGFDYSSYSRYTTILTYDLSDPTSPEVSGQVWQSGTYQESRMKDDSLYLFTSYYPDSYAEVEETSYYIPAVQGELLSPEQICIPKQLTGFNILVISAMDLNDPDEITASNAVVSGTDTFYVGQSGIYIMNSGWDDTSFTEIIHLNYSSDEILANASAKLPGSVNDTFSVDEYEGNLRVLTTYTSSDTASRLFSLLFGSVISDTSSRKNALFILDSEMEVIGRITGIARDESIRSARFLGDTAYFVTFRQTDPLFTADLSDPENPVLTDELKVTGFSSYLHPFGDDLLAGLGYEATESGTITGIKLSLFDRSNPTGVTELSRYVMDGKTSLDVLNDYRTIYANADRNLIGFYEDSHYFLFQLTDEVIELVLLYDLYSDQLYQTNDYWWNDEISTRGISIGNILYITGDGFITSFGLDTMDKISCVKF